jgi:hypothetical protein
MSGEASCEPVFDYLVREEKKKAWQEGFDAAHKVPTVEEICRIISSNTNESCFEHGMDAQHFYYFYPNDLETIATAIHNLWKE